MVFCLRCDVSVCQMPLPLTSTVRAWAVEAAAEYGRPVRRFRNESYTYLLEASRPRREHRPISARAAAARAAAPLREASMLLAARLISTRVVGKLTCAGEGLP